MNIQNSVIQQALGNDWDKVATVIRQHFDVSYKNKRRGLLRGVMQEVHHSFLAKIFIIPAQIFGALVPYCGKDIPVIVRTSNDELNFNLMHWHRTFSFPDKGDFIFSSRMAYVKDNIIIEKVKYGMAIEMALSVEEGVLKFVTTCYQWNLKFLTLRIPCWLLLGHAVISEKALSDDSFEIDFKINHPIFGKTFSYKGIFQNVNDDKE